MNKPPKPYPSYTRYYLGCVGVGLACGITWTLVMTNPLIQRKLHIPSTPAIVFLYSVAVAMLLAQAWLLVRWHRRMKQDIAEMGKKWIELKYAPMPWKDPNEPQ
jgi:hypothetical protein